MTTHVHDPVNRPSHYMLFPNIEVIDVIDKLCDKAQTSHALLGAEFGYYQQMMQYLMRFMDKNGLEDLKKAQWFLTRLIESKGTIPPQQTNDKQMELPL